MYDNSISIKIVPQTKTFFLIIFRMHFLIKGIGGKMIDLTFHADNAGHSFNLHHPQNNLALRVATESILSSAPPGRKEWPKDILLYPRSLKAAQIMTFIKIYALASLYRLPQNVFNVWINFVRLVSGMVSEFGIPKTYVHGETGLAADITRFLESYQVGRP